MRPQLIHGHLDLPLGYGEALEYKFEEVVSLYFIFLRLVILRIRLIRRAAELHIRCDLRMLLLVVKPLVQPLFEVVPRLHILLGSRYEFRGRYTVNFTVSDAPGGLGIEVAHLVEMCTDGIIVAEQHADAYACDARPIEFWPRIHSTLKRYLFVPRMDGPSVRFVVEVRLNLDVLLDFEYEFATFYDIDLITNLPLLKDCLTALVAELLPQMVHLRQLLLRPIRKRVRLLQKIVHLLHL